MKYITAIIVFFLFAGNLMAQVKCYRFSLDLQGTDWRDTSCIACTSDPAVIADVTDQLSKSLMNRNKHINGAIAGGNTWINKNGSHNFLWHFKVNEWKLYDFSMEVCDGRPYSDVDADTTYWLNTVKFFCPWSSRVAEEVDASYLRDLTGKHINISLYPNPARDNISLVSAERFDGNLDIYDLAGRALYRKPVGLSPGVTFSLDVGHLSNGFYIIRLEDGRGVMQQKLSVVR